MRTTHAAVCGCCEEKGKPAKVEIWLEGDLWGATCETCGPRLALPQAQYEQLKRLHDHEVAVAAPRGTDAQIQKERELTCAAIDGAIAYGQLGTSPPPPGHWLAHYYVIGEQLARQATDASGAG
ncbi:MAG: hypothetical protein ABI843_02370 [Dokdonella sp.]